MRRRVLALSAVFLVSALAASCTEDSTPSPAGPDASVPLLDASTDAEVLSDVVARPDAAALDDAPSGDAGGDAVTDAEVPDVVDASDASDAADADADATVDAEVDAAPALDDAGCPLPTGVVADLGDSGIPATGLSLWLRADLGVATLNAVADGGTVCRWDDVSGNGRGFVPATATPPVLAPSGLSGKPAVSFVTSGHHMVRNDVLGMSATSGRTVAVYGSNADTTRRFQFFHQGKVGTAGTFFGLDTNTFNTVGSRRGVYVTNNAYDSNVATSTAPHTEILSISSFAAGGSLPNVLVYAVDGTVTTLTRTSGGLGNGKVEDFTPADITFFGSGAAGHLGAQLGEMLVYDRELTAPERLAIEQYFKARFP